MAYANPGDAKAWRKRNAEKLKREKQEWWAANRTRSLAEKRDTTTRRAKDGICTRCARRNAEVDGAYCAECRRDGRERHFVQSYGMTLADRDLKLARQGGRCAICEASDGGPKGWHVDHDHLLGTVRGMLCGNCNIGLGHFKDNIHLLGRAMVYLTKHKGTLNAA